MHTSKFIESYFDAWNHADPHGVADHLTSDGVYLDIPRNVQRTHDELIVSLNRFFSEFPHRYELIGEALTSRDTIAFQYRVIPSSNEEVTRADITYCGAEFMTLNGNAAARITDYYDLPEPAERKKYAKSGLRREQLLEYKQRLDRLMESEQIYLQPNLTLPALARAVGCSINHLSQVINSGFEMSFFDYLNCHRIKHARRLLTQLDCESGAILNIAFSVGFNSNSAFYAAFKKYVGMTPAQYRHANIRSSS